MTQQAQIKAQALSIPMRSSFKHASAERKTTDSVWVEVSNKDFKGLGEGCPRSYVTGEKTESALAWISSIQSDLENALDSLESFKNWTEQNQTSLAENPAAWCAVELACLDYLARKESVSVEKLLGLDELEGSFQYTAVVSDESGAKLQQILGLYAQVGFTDYKFKLSGSLEDDKTKLQTLFAILKKLGATTQPRIRVDANNLWKEKPEEAKNYLKALDVPFFGVEEPIEAKNAEELSKLSQELNMAIILDESLCGPEDFELYKDLPGTWVPNIRVSKAGGLLRSLELVKKVKAAGWQAIVGAQVGETSVLSRAALTVAQALGENLTAQEGAYGTLLLEKDAVKPIIQFAEKGVLKTPIVDLQNEGWGFTAN